MLMTRLAAFVVTISISTSGSSIIILIIEIVPYK